MPWSKLLALGLWARWAAGFIFITMSVALFIAHKNDPFQVKELAYLYYWAVAGMFMAVGPGAYTAKQLIKRA